MRLDSDMTSDTQVAFLETDTRTFVLRFRTDDLVSALDSLCDWMAIGLLSPAEFLKLQKGLIDEFRERGYMDWC